MGFLGVIACSTGDIHTTDISGTPSGMSLIGWLYGGILVWSFFQEQLSHRATPNFFKICENVNYVKYVACVA